jgi:creatinine amidohydrolase/Fe(II)-dependent formamide hydrolase-like protein
MGSPQLATPEKGEHLFAEFSKGLVEFLEQVINWDGRGWITGESRT